MLLDEWNMPDWMKEYCKNGFLPDVEECEKIMNSKEINTYTTDVNTRIELLEELKENGRIL